MSTTGQQGAVSNRSNYPLLFFFFVTGLTGLAYELVWIRLLILAFGSTQFAVTTVLVTFMAGLAIGSLVFGRIIDRYSAPLKVYAGIEAALGLYCVLSPTVFNVVRDLYAGAGAINTAPHQAGFELAQFLLSFFALIIPTTLMGGTLPVLVRYLASSSGRVGFHTAIPYAINTFGAVTGCLATGLFLLYTLGVKSTVYAAGAVDIIVGLLVFLIYGSGAAAAQKAYTGHSAVPAGAGKTDKNRNLVIIAAFALSGFCSLAYEALWTRVFSLILGSSIYAFTVMLATFLVGIAAGSVLFAPVVDRLKRPLMWFAVFEAVIGVTAILSVFIYRELPFIFFNVKEAFVGRFWLFLILQFLLCSAVMIIPTLSMGAIFPLVGRLYTKSLSTVGKNIGDVYFFNTAGSIAGAFAGGFILIPVIGVQNGVILTSALNILIAVTLFAFADLKVFFKVGVSMSLAAVFIMAALALPPWERMLMTMGVYANPIASKKMELAKKGLQPSTEKLLYYKEGINAVITVREEDGAEKTLSYQANGKQEAVVTGDRPAEPWALLGHIPLLLHGKAPKEALLVGLGSGITLGAMEHYPLDGIDVVEIESAVIEAARYFKESNNSALEDKRVRLHVTDGRGYLFAKKSRYDVIVSAVSDPWITGVANLFTREYFAELSNKLNDDGVVSLWFQNYRITPNELKIGLNTFSSVFPHVSVWFHYTDTLDLIVIGSKRPHLLDMERLRKAFSDPEIRRGLQRINIAGPIDLFDLFIIGNNDLRAYAGVTALNTDERPVYEFILPKLMYLPPETGVRNVEGLLAGVRDVIPPSVVPEREREAFYLDLGKSYNRYSFRLPQAEAIFRKALEVNPRGKEAAKYLEGLKKELGGR